ncbi:MAG: glycosyl hydrolase [Oceanipulchritudo sp.]
MKTELIRLFKEPPPQARPFVRWWWNNNQVEAAELLRELDLLESAGMGGVEVNPILDPYMSWKGESRSKAKILPWRSPEWDEALHVVAKAAKKKGMIVDLIGGSSWPFGGKFLKPDEQVRRLSVFRESVSGPCRFELKLLDLFKRKRDYGYHRAQKAPVNPSLAAVWLYPENMESLSDIKEIPDAICEDGVIRLEVPEGGHIIGFGIEEWGYRELGNGVPGADGPALDHFNKQALASFMDKVLGISDTWGEPISHYIRAIFCDSIEMGEANWTHDMLDTFRERKGYELSPYLSIVLREEDDTAVMPADLREMFRRARYDWTEHQAYLFHDRFTEEFCRICHEKGLLARYQPQGNPFLMDIAKGAMLPDIPEGELWLYNSDPYEKDHFTWSQQHGSPIWIKYASTGARLKGRSIISYEAMTNVLGVFRATLASIKQTGDMAIICGATHAVLHGFNYSPPDVPFPGLVRFGTHFSEHNPWWPYLRCWTDYISRLNAVFQASEPVREIALLGPTPDLWSTVGLRKAPFHMTPPYFHQLWEAVSQCGSTCDYLNMEVVAEALAENGNIICGHISYRILLVCDLESIPPKTAEALARLAKAGTRVVFVGTLPSRAPGLAQADENDRWVQKSISNAIQAGAYRTDAPGSDLRDWLRNVLGQSGMDTRVRIESPHDGVYFQHHRHKEDDLLFFTNTGRTRSHKTFVHFPCADKSLERWNPESGDTSPYPATDSRDGFALELEPMESVLIFAKAECSPQVSRNGEYSRQPNARSGRVLDQPWQLDFIPAGGLSSFSTTFEELQDFSTHDDPRIRTFSGQVRYRTQFLLDDTPYQWLDLGNINDFICDVQVNDEKAGLLLYGKRPLRIGHLLKRGANELCITYTTTLWNQMRETKWAAAWFDNFSREIPPPTPSGIRGPVRLLP